MEQDGSGSIAEPARAASRIGGAYILRSLALLADLADGDLLSGIISLAIVQANVAHLNGRGPGAYDSLADIPPDCERRPVSIAAVAASLRLPYETTRRRVARMVRQGAVIRAPEGVVVPASALTSPRNEAHLLTNLTNMRRLARAWRRVDPSA